MPSMGHGTSTNPTVTPTGDGHYEVSNMELMMAGSWELRTTITGSTQDAATIPLTVR
jgi:hypothetical protein